MRPTGELGGAQRAAEKITLGAVLRVRSDGKRVGDAAHRRAATIPSDGPERSARSARFFEGEATSEVGLRAGLRRDMWTRDQPDIAPLRSRCAEGDRVFDGAERCPRAAQVALAQALAASPRAYAREPAAGDLPRSSSRRWSRWIWIGALIVFAGGLIALWPAPRAGARGRVAAGYAARVARELGRA